MFIRTHSSKLYRIFVISIVAALLIAASATLSQARPLGLEDGPRNPHLPSQLITVQSTADEGTAVSGNCPGPSCRLRDALAYAAHGDTIVFGDNFTITLASTLIISKNVTLDGTGYDVHVSGSNAVRVFTVSPGVNVTFRHLTIRSGRTTDSGGGVYVSAGSQLAVYDSTILSNTAAIAGGGLYVAANGAVDVYTTTIRGNTVIGPNGSAGVGSGGAGSAGATVRGGGIAVFGGTLNLQGATVISNTVGGGNGGTGAAGAAGSTGTIGGQGGAGGTGGSAFGGGLYIDNTGVVTITGSTIVSNSVTGGRGGSGSSGGTGGGGGTGSPGSNGACDWAGLFCTVGGTGGIGGPGGQGGTGGTGGQGGDALGGGLYQLGTTTVLSSTFIGNRITGGSGYTGGPGGSGGQGGTGGTGGQGGNGSTDCGEGGNGGTGGKGGTGGTGGAGGTGGNGQGGAIYSANNLDLSSSQISNNVNIQGGTGQAGAASGPVGAGGAGGAGGAPGTGGLWGCAWGFAGSGGAPGNSGFIGANGSAGLGQGAGLYNSAGTININTGSVISSNQVNGNGGGVMNAAGDITVLDSTLSGNSASNGGGLYNADSLWVENSTLSSNSVTSDGGGIYNMSGLTVDTSTFSSNTADAGAGLYNTNPGQSTLENSTLSGNSAGFGGGIYNYHGLVTLLNSTVSGNSGVEVGGGIHTQGGTLELNNTIIANSASGRDCDSDYSPTISADHSLIEATGNLACNLVNGSGGSLVGIDPMLRPLSNYGGATQTFAPLPGSPIVDAGNNSTCLEADQRGVARPQGAACDIGAVEWRGYALTKSGDNQSAAINTSFAQPLGITFGEAGGVGWPGMTITYTAPASGASIVSPTTVTATTDANGQTAISVAANSVAGSYGVAARASSAGPVTFTLANTYLITPTTGAHGTITPSTPQLVNSGSAITFTITPDVGYHVTDVRVDGIAHGAIGSYTFSNVTAHHTISAAFAINTYTITSTAGAHGSISPNTPQTVTHGGTLVFTITPDSGYSIADVVVDGVPQGALGSYTFSNIAAPHTISATFGNNLFTITPSAGAGGSLTPGTPQAVTTGDAITFTVAPNTGYHIVDVEIDGVSHGPIGSYAFNNVITNHTISGWFAINSYTLTPTAGTHGSIWPDTPQTVNYGDEFLFTIAPDTGYHIVDVGVDGVSHGPIDSYTFNGIAANHTISAAFALNTYTITPTAGAHGSISPGTPQTVNHGEAITFTIAADANYHLVEVVVDGVPQGTIQSYTLSDVTADHTINASFAIDTHIITPTAGANGSISPDTPQTVNHGAAITFTITPDVGYHIVEVDVDGSPHGPIDTYTFNHVTADHTISASFALNTYTLTPLAGAGGTITPDTAQTVNYGEAITFTIAPDANYHLVDVGVDGVSQGAIGSYTFSNVTADHMISASFAIDTHIITPLAGANGSISPDTPQTVNHGDAITFTITPDTGYHVAEVGVDGVLQGAIGSYTFSTVITNHTITASFAINTYTITPTAGTHGSVSPSTPQTVNYGSSLTFTITPDSGYSIADVVVDGVSQGAIGSYTFSNVAAHHTISASFADNLFTITPSAGPGGSINPGTPQAVTTGNSITFTITPDAGYAIDDVGVDGMSQGAIGSYTFSNVTANHTISAAFVSTGPQTRTVGVISVMADTFADLGNGQTLATGNIRLGHYLFLTDTTDSVLYDSTNLTATGKVTVIANGSTLSVVTGTFRAPITTGVAVPIGTPDDLITSAAGFVLTNVVVSDINIPIDQFSVNANLNVVVKDITITTGVDLYVSGASSGLIYSGTLGAFDFAVGGVTVTVAPSMTLSNTGIAIPAATITLPESLGGASGTINNLTLTSSGLTLEDGSLTLPDIKWGDGSKIKLLQPIAHLSVMTDTYQFNANGTLSLTLPSNNLTTTLGFTLTPGGQMTGTLSNLNLTVAGAVLTMTNIAVSNSGLSVNAAELQLPESLGNAVTTLSDVSIGADGLTLGNGTFSLPVIRIGDGQKISITQSLAQLSIGQAQYQFAVTGTLNLNLPSNAFTTTLGFAMQNGQMTGTLSSLNLSVAGATLGMTNALISNAGCSVATATLQLPTSLGSGTANLSNIGVYSNGLHLGSGTFNLPVIKIGDGSRISITNSTAQLAIADNEYDLDVSSTLNLNLPGNQLHPDLGFSLHGGEMTGTLSSLNLSVAGATLGMTNALISNAGFAVTTATLQLPASLGSGTANLSNVGVYSNGLNLGSGTFALPVIKIGDGSRISLTNSTAQLAIADNEYDLDVTSTLNLNLPGNQLHPDLGFSLHAGQMTGTLSSLNLSVAGATLGMTNALISNAGFAVATATLQLPASLGNTVTMLNDVSIGADGLTLGNGTFSLPAIKIGDGQKISITNSTAQLSIGNDQYNFAVTGTLNLNLPSNALSTTLGFAMQNGEMTGTLSSLHLTMAGSTLVMTDVVVSNVGLSVNGATLQLPASLGGTVAAIGGLTIDQSGLTLEQGTLALPDIKWGDGSKVKIARPSAQLTVLNNQYQFSANGTLNLTLPNNNISSTLGFTVTNGGQLTGTVNALNLSLAGGTLTMTNIAVTNNGLSVAAAQLILPSSLGGGLATVNDVTINENGLSVSAGMFTVADINIGDGSKVKIANPTATLSNTVEGYTFGINGILQLRLPDNSQNIVISGTVNTSGQFYATISSISLTLAKATLQLNRISMDNTGLSVVSGTLALPAKLGGASGQVADVRIDANGLSIGSGSANFPIPDFKIGGTAGFGVSNALATLNLVNISGSMSYQMALSGTIAITLPGTSATAQGLVQLDNAGNISGRVNAFTLAVAGLNLSVNNISINPDGSFAIASATLALPGGFGGGSANVSNVVVYPGQPGSLSLGSAGISLPDIKWGDGSKVKIINANAQLTQVNNRYSFAFGGKLSLNLPGNVVTSTLAFSIRDDGQISGTVDLIKLTVAGGTLTMTNVGVQNSGLTVGAASLKMPASLGSAVVTISGVSINETGLHLGGGQLTLADINIGDGSKVKIAAPTATLGSIPSGYTFGISGTLQLRLPSNSQNIGIGGTINSNGQFTATVSALALTFGGATLNLSNVTLNNTGLSVVSGTLQLPAKLGGASGGVNNVVINSNGLSIGGGSLTFPIPDFKIGGASGFSVSHAQAGLQLTNGGLSYRLNLSGTVAIKIPGSNASASGRMNMDDAGNMSGQVDAFTLTIAGMGLNVSNVSINPDGSFTAGAAGFTTPSGFGGASASVYNVVIRPGDPGSVSIGGGSFTLPPIKAGGFGLALSGALKPITSGYEISATGFATFPGVGGAAGCAGVGVGATIWTNAQGQTQLVLRPDETNGFALKNASFNLQCQIAIGTTGFFITGIQGEVTLGPTSTQVDVGIQIAAGKKIAGFTVLSADATATIKTNPFDLLINGAVRVFVFQVGGATAHMTDHSFNATLWVNMIVAKGDIAFNAWSDYRGFHMNGSGSMQVGLAKGSIFNGTSLPYPCCECGWQSGWLGVPYWWCGNCQICWTESLTIPSADYLFNTSTAFGEFEGDRWGVKGTVSLLGYNAGFFVDSQGNLTVGNVDSYQLVQPVQVNAAIEKWQAARRNGLAPEAAFESDGIRFVGDSVRVPQPITTTTDVIFALQRSQSVPTLTLMTPLGAEITPDNLPAGVQFTEVLTYTRDVSATTPNGANLCATPDTVQKAAQTVLVRFTQARSDLGAIDVLIDGVKVFANVSYGAESIAQVIDAGSHTLDLVPANQPGPIVHSTPITLTGNVVHRLIAAGDVTQTATLDVAQDVSPATGQATVRFAHALADAANVDVVLASEGRVLFGDVAPQSVTDGINLDASQTYTFEVYAAGTTQLVAQLPNVTLTGRGTYSLIALGRIGGTPSAQLLLKADTLPLSHLRFVNAIAADQPIELWTQGITLFANLPYSATSAYNGFAADAIDFQVTTADLAHTVLNSGQSSLQSQADHTLVALDYVTQTQTLLLIDDNRLPAWGKARVRFVNAAPNVGAVDVFVQGAAQFSNVAFKNASPYVELNGGTTTIEVRDHATQSVLLSMPEVNVIDGYVYTWFLMGVSGGSPALQLVPSVDLATRPDIQTQYVVDQAQAGTWELKLNGNFTATDQYLLTALGSNPAPALSDLSAVISGTNSLVLSWRLSSDELGTPIGIYADPGVDLSFAGRALAVNLTSSDPGWINGTLQTYSVNLNQLPSGTYHIWFEANDGRNTPVRQYAPQTIVVNHVATWPLTWTAAMTVTPGFRELNVQWQSHANPDTDVYVLKVSALTTTQVISVGNLTSALVTALEPDRPYSLTVQAIDNDTGHVSTAQTGIGVPANAAINLSGPNGPINLIAGQSQNTALLITTSDEPYPGVVSFQTDCVRLSGTTCTSSVNGLNALFTDEYITPTLAGVSEAIVISVTDLVPAGNYVVPVIATGSGLSRTFDLNVAVSVPVFTLDVDSQTVSLGIAESHEVTVSSAGLNGATRPIGLSVKNAPVGLLWSMSNAVIDPGESATLTITDTDLLASGLYPIEIRGDDGVLTATTTITLTVSKPRFTLTATPSNVTVGAGKLATTTFKLDLLALDGWTTPITLTIDSSAVPAPGVLGLRPNAATGALSNTLAVQAGSTAYLVAVTAPDMPRGLYTFSINAQGGGRQQTLEVTLAVREFKVYLPLVMRSNGVFAGQIYLPPIAWR